MVLLPGCACCESCEIPGGLPDSVEVDISRDSLACDVTIRQTSLTNGFVLDRPQRLEFAQTTGTYSLARVGSSYVYDSTAVRLEFFPDNFNVTATKRQQLVVTVKFIATSDGLSCGTLDAYAVMSLFCDTSTISKTYTLTKPIGFPYTCTGTNTSTGTSGTGQFVSGCSLPVLFTFDAVLRAVVDISSWSYVLIGNTFSSTDYEFSGRVINLHAIVPVSVTAMRLIYGTTSVNHFVRVGDTACVNV